MPCLNSHGATFHPLGQYVNLIADVFSSKFLNLITWVQFENTECAGSAGDNGTCFTSNECTEIGGSADGACASGFGVCCVLKVNSGVRINL